MTAPKDFDLEAGTTTLYVDSTYYDFEYGSRLVDAYWYVERYLEAEGPVLELGVGTGRIAVRAARKGATVVGLDRAWAMLVKAAGRKRTLPRGRVAHLQLVRGDMRQFALDARFAVISCPFNAFQHMYTRADAEACLTCVRAHLRPDGLFIFDILMPDLEYFRRPANERFPGARFRHPSYGTDYAFSEQSSFDPVSQICHMRFYYDRVDKATKGSDGGPPSLCIQLSHRYFFPAELEALLHHNGFEVLERYGDFAGGPLQKGSENQVLICCLRDPQP